MNRIDIEILANITGAKRDSINYISTESYPCGLHNCCYHHTYIIGTRKYYVECHCGCEKQTVPDGSFIQYIIERIKQ